MPEIAHRLILVDPVAPAQQQAVAVELEDGVEVTIVGTQKKIMLPKGTLVAVGQSNLRVTAGTIESAVVDLEFAG